MEEEPSEEPSSQDGERILGFELKYCLFVKTHFNITFGENDSSLVN